ncbi:Uncharacterized protein APZ42_031895 [Daphnia magna]|uniref:Uncharacterized protein n=1 Tax=Daphnia magna TaxID=35525 RepID=A0A162DAE1_9CRUS|nr:Uncharacterized protein APZ42_031895 [Daphnia magna]
MQDNVVLNVADIFHDRIASLLRNRDGPVNFMKSSYNLQFF